MTPQQVLEHGLHELGLALPGLACEKLLAYVALLVKWNRIYNLTAIRAPREMVTHHLLDSLAVVPCLPVPPAHPLLADAGSGAGLPGIPIALACPDWRVTLVEASEKKAAFLRQAAIELVLPNVAVHEGRVELWRPVQRFSIVISRAFSELADFLAACRHLAAPGGVLVAMKGRHPRAELSRIGGDCACSPPIRLRVPLLDAERHLVFCDAGH